LISNSFKDENLKLKARLRMIEAEMQKKDKFIEEMIIKAESTPQHSSNFSKQKKLESHLTVNLKKRFKEMQTKI
jgi:hypothetical protein